MTNNRFALAASWPLHGAGGRPGAHRLLPKRTIRRRRRHAPQCDPDRRPSASTSGSTPSRRPVSTRPSRPPAWSISTTTRPPAYLAPSPARCRGCWLLPATRSAKGQPLAMVDSPDFAAAVSAYRKALATARNRPPARRHRQGPAAHNGVSQREAEQAQTDAANAEADRDAALQALRRAERRSRRPSRTSSRAGRSRTSKASSARRSPAPWSEG